MQILLTFQPHLECPLLLLQPRRCRTHFKLRNELHDREMTAFRSPDEFQPAPKNPGTMCWHPSPMRAMLADRTCFGVGLFRRNGDAAACSPPTAQDAPSHFPLVKSYRSRAWSLGKVKSLSWERDDARPFSSWSRLEDECV
jgi:hypothetical protein